MSKAWIAVVVALLTTSAAQVEAAPTTPAKAPAGPAVTMPSTQMFELKAEDGQIYRIFVSFPGTETAVPTDGWPVLYVLDGNAMFAGFAEARRMQEFYDTGKMIVVGVGYPTDQAYDVRRLDDYTPPLLNPAPANMRPLAQYKSGGQDKFIGFLTGKLRAEIGTRFKINPDRQSLFGHSLGGLVALHTLYSRPQSFYSIVAASPSIEWNEQGILREERDFAARLTSGRVTRPSRLMVVVGDVDRDDNPDVAQAFVHRMDALSGYGLRTRFQRFEREGHMGVPARAVTETLRFVTDGY